jgi:hypothetical protein
VPSARVFIAWLAANAREIEPKPVHLFINCYRGLERPDLSKPVKSSAEGALTDSSVSSTAGIKAEAGDYGRR